MSEIARQLADALNKLRWLPLAKAMMTPEAYEESSKELIAKCDALEKEAKRRASRSR